MKNKDQLAIRTLLQITKENISSVIFLVVHFFIQPKELISENGLLEVTLDVGLIESLHGIPWSDTKTRIAPAFNGAPMGPTLRVKPGDTLKVTLNNQLDPPSALDLELRDYVYDPTSDPLNLTIISNRLDQIGNTVSNFLHRQTPIFCFTVD